MDSKNHAFYAHITKFLSSRKSIHILSTPKGLSEAQIRSLPEKCWHYSLLNSASIRQPLPLFREKQSRCRRALAQEMMDVGISSAKGFPFFYWGATGLDMLIISYLIHFWFGWLVQPALAIQMVREDLFMTFLTIFNKNPLSDHDWVLTKENLCYSVDV